MRIDTVEQRVSAQMALREAMEKFYDTHDKAYADRDAAIREAATRLSQREVCAAAELSPETIRQITKGHPVSWKRRPANG